MNKRFRFNTVGLFTRDNRATVDFYTKVFGFITDWDVIIKEKPVYETARLQRPGWVSYVIVNNYRTIIDDFRDMYLFSIQVDNRLTKEVRL